MFYPVVCQIDSLGLVCDFVARTAYLTWDNLVLLLEMKNVSSLDMVRIQSHGDLANKSEIWCISVSLLKP